MAPKKGGKPAKGKGDDEGPDAKEMAGILEAQLMTLKQRIVYEQERSMKAMEKTDELTTTKAEMAKDSEERKNQTRIKVDTMTGAYKKMQEEQTEKIRNSQAIVEEQNAKKKQLQMEIENAHKAKEEMIREKDANI